MDADGCQSQGRLLARAMALQVATRNLVASYGVADQNFTNRHHLKVLGSFRPWAFVFTLSPVEPQRILRDMRGALEGLTRADSLSSYARPERQIAGKRLAELQSELEFAEE